MSENQAADPRHLPIDGLLSILKTTNITETDAYRSVGRLKAGYVGDLMHRLDSLERLENEHHAYALAWKELVKASEDLQKVAVKLYELSPPEVKDAVYPSTTQK